MVEFVKARWAVLVSFATGWATETFVGLSDFVNAALAALGVK